MRKTIWYVRMHAVVCNYAVSECDLLIALGARFDDRVTGKTTRIRL
jgi:acetolactate synthase-1/2/3 large subunit